MSDDRDLRLRRKVLQDGVTAEERSLLAAGHRPAEIVLGRVRKQKRRRGVWWGLGLIGGAGLFALTLWVLRTFVPESFPPETAEAPAEPAISLVAVPLYFGASDGQGLIEEVRFLARSGHLEDDVEDAISALLSGPAGEAISPWPPEATLQDLFISQNGIAYVSFGGALRWLLPRGDFMEWTVVASLTRTLCTGFAEIKGVRILVDGESSGQLRRVMPLDWTYRPAMFAGRSGHDG